MRFSTSGSAWHPACASYCPSLSLTLKKNLARPKSRLRLSHKLRRKLLSHNA